jgi:hypothetical protein
MLNFVDRQRDEVKKKIEETKPLFLSLKKLSKLCFILNKRLLKQLPEKLKNQFLKKPL